MSRTDPESVYYSTPTELRERKPLTISLAEDELAALARLAAHHDVSRSCVVGQLILRADEALRPRKRGNLGATPKTTGRKR